MSDDEIFDYYDQEVADKDSAAFAFHLVDMVPDSELNPVEMFENSPEFTENNYELILDGFADDHIPFRQCKKARRLVLYSLPEDRQSCYGAFRRLPAK